MQACRGMKERQLGSWNVVVVCAVMLLVGCVLAGGLLANGTGVPGAGPTITAPSVIGEGKWLEGVATDVDGGVSVEVRDGAGTVLYFSVDPGQSHSFRVFIPDGTTGPLLITAADANGYETIKSVDVVDTGQIEE